MGGLLLLWETENERRRSRLLGGAAVKGVIHRSKDQVDRDWAGSGDALGARSVAERDVYHEEDFIDGHGVVVVAVASALKWRRSGSPHWCICYCRGGCEGIAGAGRTVAARVGNDCRTRPDSWTTREFALLTAVVRIDGRCRCCAVGWRHRAHGCRRGDIGRRRGVGWGPSVCCGLSRSDGRRKRVGRGQRGVLQRRRNEARRRELNRAFGLGYMEDRVANNEDSLTGRIAWV